MNRDIGYTPKELCSDHEALKGIPRTNREKLNETRVFQLIR